MSLSGNIVLILHNDYNVILISLKRNSWQSIGKQLTKKSMLGDYEPPSMPEWHWFVDGFDPDQQRICCMEQNTPEQHLQARYDIDTKTEIFESWKTMI
jgi:hypothetical protein